MHVQARAKPARSPADLAAFLQELAADADADRDAINVEGVGGASIEQGGNFVFAVADGREGDAHDRLDAVGYRCEWTTDVYHEEIPPAATSETVQPSDEDPNRPGVLVGIIQRAKGSTIADGRNIDTVLIGAFTDRPGHFFAQVTFEGARWTTDRPGPHPENPHPEG